jgi:hypothetical protein
MASRRFPWLAPVAALISLGLASVAATAFSGPRRDTPPAFSEEREAAALHFVKKHAAELLPVLEKLKTSDPKKYQAEVCELFQTCEWLTDMRHEDEKRYNLELDVWRTETRSLLLVARLAGLKEDERDKHKAEVEECARKLIDLEMLIMKHRIETLEKELGEARDEFTKAEEQKENLVKDRFSKLVEEAKRRGMMK